MLKTRSICLLQQSPPVPVVDIKEIQCLGWEIQIFHSPLPVKEASVDPGPSKSKSLDGDGEILSSSTDHCKCMEITGLESAAYLSHPVLGLLTKSTSKEVYSYSSVTWASCRFLFAL